jgi:hypothetical protein
MRPVYSRSWQHKAAIEADGSDECQIRRKASGLHLEAKGLGLPTGFQTVPLGPAGGGRKVVGYLRPDEERSRKARLFDLGGFHWHSPI